MGANVLQLGCLAVAFQQGKYDLLPDARPIGETPWKETFPVGYYVIAPNGLPKPVLEKLMAASKIIVASDEFKDAFDIFSAFAQNAATDYSAEAGKVAAIGSSIASENAKLMHRQAANVIEDIAATTVA